MHDAFTFPCAHNDTSTITDGKSSVSASDEDFIPKKGATSVMQKFYPGIFSRRVYVHNKRLQTAQRRGDH